MVNPERQRLPITLRDASPDDAAAIAGIQYLTWRDRYPKLGNGITEEMIDARFKPDGTLNAREARWRQTIESLDPDTRFIVAELDGQVVGYNIPTNNDDGKGIRRPSALYVLPGHQGKGIGSMLLTESLNWLEADRYETQLHVVANNLDTIKLYERFGFQEAGLIEATTAPFENGATMPEMLMVREPQPIAPS